MPRIAQHIYILFVIVCLISDMKFYGWQKKRKFPVRRRTRTHRIPKTKIRAYTLSLRWKFSHMELIHYYRRVFGRECPCPLVIMRWYFSLTTPSEADSVLLSDYESTTDQWEWHELMAVHDLDCDLDR